MRRTLLVLITTVVATAALQGSAADPFARPLTGDKRTLHVLNRLAYGPRSADVAIVNQLGVTTWIQQQLRPERIAENPILAKRLQPLETTRLATWQIFENYQNVPFTTATAPTPLPQLMPAGDVTKLDTGTAEERRAILSALSGEKRKRVLIVVSPKALEGLADLQVEAFNIRRAADDERTAEMRRLRPPLNEILTPDQMQKLSSGTSEEKASVINTLEPVKRQQFMRQYPPALMPEAFRREAISHGQRGQLSLIELVDAKIYRATYSTHQLEEVLVDFWLNHFNVFSGKGPIRTLLSSYERDAIRPHVFGRFRDMVLATARHPAMLFYLDNWQSQVTREAAELAAGAKEPKPTGLNENYGRELLELHTLGVDGGYTQQDVLNVARAFTGWTIHEPGRYGEFYFNPGTHDRGEKVVLGHTIPRGGGESDGLQVIDIVSRHPSTARFISLKLAQRFVADQPPRPLVDRMARAFTRTNGDLRAVVEVMLLSPEFMSEGAWRAKIKSPFELVTSALRGLDADVTDTMILAQRIADLGQPLYGKLEPIGYPNVSTGWASSASLAGRINLMTALTSQKVYGIRVDLSKLPASPPAAAKHLLGLAPSPTVVNALSQPGASLPKEALAAMLVASPDFQKR